MRIVSLPFIFLLLMSYAHAWEIELKDGEFGSDGLPMDCESSYYETEHLQTLCSIALVENVSVSALYLTTMAVQLEVGAGECQLALDEEVNSKISQYKSSMKKTYDVANAYQAIFMIKDCEYQQGLISLFVS